VRGVKGVQESLWPAVAVDLGTVNTLVYVAGRGLVLDEPSILAVCTATGAVVAVGKQAAALWGRAPKDLEVIKPLYDGVVSDPDACSLMLEGFLRRVRRRRLGHSAAVVCVPGCATDVERRALVQAVNNGSPGFQVSLVEEPVAAALGSGFEVSSGSAVLIVDIGGGTTDMGVVVEGGIVCSRSIRVGGNKMDEAIMHAVRTQLGLVIGERAAEGLKVALGLSGNGIDSISVVGVDPGYWGSLRPAEVPAALVAKALERPVSAIVTGLTDLLAELPPDLAEEVLDKGAYLAGGGALLHGLAERISEQTGLKATVVDDPLRCVLRGLTSTMDCSANPSRASQHSHAA
jgi:rod shape-determining protein MreB and related proteins